MGGFDGIESPPQREVNVVTMSGGKGDDSRVVFNGHGHLSGGYHSFMGLFY